MVGALLISDADPVAAWAGTTGHDRQVATEALESPSGLGTTTSYRRSMLMALSPEFIVVMAVELEERARRQTTRDAAECLLDRRPVLTKALIFGRIGDACLLLQYGANCAEALGALFESGAEQVMAFLCNNASAPTPQQRTMFAAADDRLVQLDAFNRMPEKRVELVRHAEVHTRQDAPSPETATTDGIGHGYAVTAGALDQSVPDPLATDSVSNEPLDVIHEDTIAAGATLGAGAARRRSWIDNVKASMRGLLGQPQPDGVIHERRDATATQTPRVGR